MDETSGPRAADGPVLTVREVNRLIAARVDGELEGLRCRGEVSDLAVRSSAVYFDLVGEEAAINCFMWRSRYDDLDVDLVDGAELVLRGDVSYYVERGRVNLRPWAVSVVGEGEAAEALRELREELRSRGWFDDEHDKPVPRYPQRVGVVTSAHGDARHDVRQALHDRHPGVDVLLCHAGVQGDGAPTELADAIHRLDRHAAVDAIVVCRGGGSDTDLAAFDTEAVAEAIFTAETPVVAAVGHREDRTVADEVADATAITPTDAGEVVAADREATLEQVAALEARLVRAYEGFVERELDGVERRLEAASESLNRRRELRVQAVRARRYRAAAVALALLLAAAIAFIVV